MKGRKLLVSPEDYDFVSALHVWFDASESDPVRIMDPYRAEIGETSLVALLAVRVWRTYTSNEEVLHYKNRNKLDLRRENVLVTHWEEYYLTRNKQET
jgi:hypothetical protein